MLFFVLPVDLTQVFPFYPDFNSHSISITVSRRTLWEKDFSNPKICFLATTPIHSCWHYSTSVKTKGFRDLLPQLWNKRTIESEPEVTSTMAGPERCGKSNADVMPWSLWNVWFSPQIWAIICFQVRVRIQTTAKF